MARGVVVALVLVSALILITGCAPVVPAHTGKPLIVTTIYPLYDLARQVGGDKVDVLLLVPPGAEPHEFEPKPSDIEAMTRASLFIYIGADMEPWAKSVLNGLGMPVRTLEAESVSSLLSSQEEGGGITQAGGYDPHIWLDVGNDEKIVTAIAEQLAAIDPANAPTYNTNADTEITALEQLDSDYRAGLADCRLREFITGGHAAFGYLANRYNLTEVSAYGLSPNAEPSLQHISDLATIAKQKRIKVIYFETLVSPKMAQTLASEVGATTAVLVPGDNVLKEQIDARLTLIELMRQDLAALRQGLECT
jgi:zinc transport system substrate-binding protein